MLKIYNTYIHIPFCERKCNYCDFTSLKGSDSQIERYVNYLLKEIEIYSQKYDLSQKQDTIYFGGGTPSLLPIDSLEKISSKFSYDKNTEITIEVNPKTVDTNKLKEYRDYQKGIEGLPKADVIQMVLEDETYLTVRPSGTEPKIKFYISVVDSDRKVAENKLTKMEKEFVNYAENL